MKQISILPDAPQLLPKRPSAQVKRGKSAASVFASACSKCSLQAMGPPLDTAS
jgi:hypothetical protein